MKKIITIAMAVCILLTTIVLAAPVTFGDVAENYESTPVSTSVRSPFSEVVESYESDSSVSDITAKIGDIGSTSVGIIRSPMGSMIAIIRVILTLLPLVLFLITFIYAIRWLINNKKDKESEKTKKLSKKAIGFAIATVVSFVLYIGFSVIIIPLSYFPAVF